jgi:hypothetical protein
VIVGAAKASIAPDRIVDLSGFAARTQPMMGVLDPIHAKALYLESANEKLLWLNFDVLALSHDFVREFREWAHRELKMANVLLSATHTHAAPAVVSLTGCGKCDQNYLGFLQQRAQQAAREAIADTSRGELVFTLTDFPLAIDRRDKPSAHVDSILSALGWRGPSGEFIATVLNYPMHPVSLGHVNRQASADWCGGADRSMTTALPGAPITLVTNGACGNLNPPARPVPPGECDHYGQQVASAIAEKLRISPATDASLRIAVDHVALPLESLSAEQMDAVVSSRINEFENTNWSRTFREALMTWRETQKANPLVSIDIELFALDLGPVVVLAISGELFSRFTTILRERIKKPLFVVGYANAVFGYIPTKEAYEEGGYEVDQAHFFYNSFRPRKGGLEMLAERAIALINRLISSPAK